MALYRRIIEHAYPDTTAENLPFKITSVPPTKGDNETFGLGDDRDKIDLGFSFNITDVPQDTIPRTRGAMLSLVLADGRQWQSEQNRCQSRSKETSPTSYRTRGKTGAQNKCLHVGRTFCADLDGERR